MTVNKELTRLRRVKLETLTPATARRQLETTIQNLDRIKDETAARDAEQQKRLQAATVGLNVERRKTTALNKEIEDLKAQLKAAELKGAEAEDDPGIKMTGAFGARIEEYEARIAQKDAQIRAHDAIRKDLQAKLDAVNTEAKTVATDEIFKGFAADIEKASKDIPDAFEIADVQVELRGALGREGNKMVMGLDARRQVDAEQATRVAFTLRRAAKIKLVE